MDTDNGEGTESVTVLLETTENAGVENAIQAKL